MRTHGESYGINHSFKLKRVPLLLAIVLVAGATGVISAAGYGLFFIVVLVFFVFLKRPDLAVYVAIIVAPLTVATGSIFEGNIGRTLLPVDMLFLLVVLCTLIKSFLYKGHHFNLKPAVMAWIAMILVGLGMGLLLGYEATLREGRGLLWYFIVPLYPAIFGKHQENIALLKGLSGTLFLANCLALLASFGLFNPVAGHVTQISEGIYRNVGDMVISIPAIFLGLSWLIYRPARRTSLMWGIALMNIGLIVLLASVTRGFWVGFIVGLFILAILLFAQRASGTNKKRLLFGIAAVLTITIVSQVLMQFGVGVNLARIVLERFQLAAYGGDENVIIRVVEARAYFDSFLSSPIWGHGIGSLVYNPIVNRLVHYSHNEYLFIMQTMGILGLMAFGWLFSFTWGSINYGLRSTRTAPEVKALLSALAGTLIAFFVISMSSPLFRGVSVTPYLVVWIGFALAQSRKERT